MVLFTDYLTGAHFEAGGASNKNARRRFLAVLFGHSQAQAQGSGYMSKPVAEVAAHLGEP